MSVDAFTFQIISFFLHFEPVIMHNPLALMLPLVWSILFSVISNHTSLPWLVFAWYNFYLSF